MSYLTKYLHNLSVSCYPTALNSLGAWQLPSTSGKDGEPDSWFLFDLYKVLT